jgi:hypothetical protein
LPGGLLTGGRCPLPGGLLPGGRCPLAGGLLAGGRWVLPGLVEGLLFCKKAAKTGSKIMMNVAVSKITASNREGIFFIC